MKQDIGRQPDVITALAPHLALLHAQASDIAARGGIGRVWVIGCGDGLFAAQMTAAHARAAGLDWQAVGPMDLLVEPARIAADDIAILLTMSGNVDRTVAAATLLNDRGVRMLAVVNGNGGRVGQIARDIWSMEIADLAPFLCGTSSFTATVIALQTVTDALAGRPFAHDPQLAAQMQDAVSTAENLLCGFDFAGVDGLRFLGAGAALGLAHYGAAKCVEVAARPVWAAEMEEFAHSQFWTMSPNNLVVLIATTVVEASYADAAADALAQMGVRTLALDTAAGPVHSATHQITVSDAGISGMMHVPALQYLAYGLGVADGLDPNRRLHLKADEARFRTSRLLTRRSLLGTGA